MKTITKMPVVVLRGDAVLPNTNITIDIITPEHIAAVEFAKANKTKLLIVVQIDPRKDVFSYETVYKVGAVGDVMEITKRGEREHRLFFASNDRGLLSTLEKNAEGYYEGVVSPMSYYNEKTPKAIAYYEQLKELMDRYFEANKKITPEMKKVLRSSDGANVLTNMLGQILVSSNRQSILNENNTEERLALVVDAIVHDIEVARIESDIARKIEGQIRDMERDTIIRNQIKGLKDQLGEDEADGLDKKIAEIQAPKEVVDKLKKECEKLSNLQPFSQEANLLRSYLDFALNLPWNKESDDCLKLDTAKAVLDADHFGIEKVKDRILEYLAVSILSKGKNRGTILCLVGAPGVGKTSVAKSIAKAIGKEYIQMSLGGIRDEAEIRGHRKTYLGAMAGRILTNLNTVGVSNPLFLLDEIDKLTSDMRGDPSSALLEVLDPNQNKNFRDNYLEMPYDLSKVMFVATANSVDNIQKPLLDRMEIIEMSGYTIEEKTEIAKRYLIPKRLENNGLKDISITIKDNAIVDIIDKYTREAGVRSLERKIDAICRKIARLTLETGITEFIVDESDLQKYLGVGREVQMGSDYINSEGVATGLAWTSTGGATLYIEVSTTEGKGGLMLTGKLGEVMQESAKTAVSYVKANYKKFEIGADVFEKTDLHIHVPEGATPKDGPSAGITIATAIVSALTKKIVRKDVAMTGEITLRGRVLPIGGLKEKSLAAMRCGIKTIIIPDGNKSDLSELPDSLTEKLKFITISDAYQAIKIALEV